jgi:hypothetical protein
MMFAAAQKFDRAMRAVAAMQPQKLLQLIDENVFEHVSIG